MKFFHLTSLLILNAYHPMTKMYYYKIDILSITERELGIIIFANGDRTLKEIAQLIQKSERDVGYVLVKAKKLDYVEGGLISEKKSKPRIIKPYSIKSKLLLKAFKYYTEIRFSDEELIRLEKIFERLCEQFRLCLEKYLKQKDTTLDAGFCYVLPAHISELNQKLSYLSMGDSFVNYIVKSFGGHRTRENYEKRKNYKQFVEKLNLSEFLDNDYLQIFQRITNYYDSIKDLSEAIAVKKEE